MIKVNLVRNRVQDSTQAADIVIGDRGNESRSALVKIAFILLFTVGLMMWESQTIRGLNQERARVQSQVNELETQLAAKATEVEGIQDVAKQAEELQDKLKVLKLLSRLRLREVKTLDFMQSKIPEKVWLQKISFEADRTSMDKGKFQFIGSAVSTEDLTDFVKVLEDSAYMMEVIVIKNQEVQGPGRTGSLRDYVFTAEVEAKN